MVVGLIGNAIHPGLVNSHPLLLVAMEPRNRYLLLVADKVSFLPFLLVATIRRLVSDPLFYLLGYLYGDRGVRWIERQLGDAGGVVRGFEGLFAKAAPVLVFLFPGAIVCVLAGATGMSPVLFVLFNVAGTVAVVSLVYRFADVPLLATPLNARTNFYGDNWKWLLPVSIGFTALWIWNERRHGRLEIQSISAIEGELEGEEDGAIQREPSEGDEGEGRSGAAGRPGPD
jgi:membrane protein DedA with SNARE-associated domain